MRRVVQLLVLGSVVAGLAGVLAVPAAAQTGDLAAFCAARIEANTAETRKETLAVFDKLEAAAPAVVLQPLKALHALYTKKGDKAFESAEGLPLLTQLDSWVYDNCPGKQLPVTAIDYQFQGVPATLAGGPTKLKLTNNSPAEDHEMVLARLLPAGESIPLDKLFSLPDKKLGKYVDFSKSAFMFAPPGKTGYTPVTLEAGKYVYACFLPQAGKKNGTPHYKLGMQGSLTVL